MVALVSPGIFRQSSRSLNFQSGIWIMQLHTRLQGLVYALRQAAGCFGGSVWYLVCGVDGIG